ncbi:MAG: hypothetical protein P4L56_15940 [Candidatus Sulfopaludibacter sp.]|nr:hypothetical protein [Candidatus Sulfopaludibacter sp.]
MHFALALVAAAVLLPQFPVRAQDKPGPPIYKVEFNIRDGGDTAAKGTRHYTLLVEPNRKAIFKVGNRVPVASGSFQPGSNGVNPLVNTQYTYIDIGVNIECVVSDQNGRILLHGDLDLSTVAPADAAARAAIPANPTVVQTKLNLDTAVEAGKPTVIAAIDDPVTARQFQVEATVVRIN